MTTPPVPDVGRHIEVRRSVDLRPLLEEAAAILWMLRDTSGAPNTLARVERDLRAVVAELDARPSLQSLGGAPPRT